MSIHIKINLPIATSNAGGGVSALDYLIPGVLCLLVLAVVLVVVVLGRRKKPKSQTA